MKKPESDVRIRPAVFLDRDGVLNVDHGYVHRTEDLVIPRGVPEALALLASLGHFLLVITNQSGVARGLYSEADVGRFHAAMQTQLQARGTQVDRFYVCPHHPRGSVAAYACECSCRKPGIALLEAAGREFAIDWQRSFMVGDKASDVECGRRAGVKTIQIASRYDVHPNADYRASDLLEAARLIQLESEKS